MFGGDYLMQSIPIHDNWVFHDNDPDVEPLFVNENGRILRFAFKPGQSVKEHTAPNLPVYIAVLKGEGLFSGADSREKRFGAGDLLIFDIGEAHAIRADNEELVALLEFFASEPTELTADLVAIIEQIALQLGHVVERNQAEKALQNSQRRLRQLAGWVVEAQEEERQRVSRELHDEAGQALTALKISLELIQASLPEELTAVCDSLSDAINLTDETMEGIRLLAYNLRPPVLDQFGLDASLEGLCRDFAERIQVPISYQGIELLSLPDPTATSLFPVVGIGASAGGLAAFEEFFAAMPADVDPGMAFILVQHLSPDHKSLLTELVRRYTRMQVYEVEDGMTVQPNCAYIIPPKHDMAFLHGKLHLLEPDTRRGLRLPIDFFFRSLAQDQRERAICIVLSGTGSDGTLGLRAIKEAGGMAMAQTPDSTEFDGMPRSAIATGLVDYVLLPAEMPAQLMAYTSHAYGKKPGPAATPRPKEDGLNKIFVLLRAQTGHDFSHYKQNTITRRIERRMAVQQIDQIDEYIRYLQQNKAEVEALFHDFLIGVTHFFRDPEAFAALESQAIPQIVADKAGGDLVRVWVPGCSTGEEAYSIAILLREQMDALKQRFKVQIFATDIDSRAIATARAGVLSGQHCRRYLPGTAGSLF
jgi:quercetin dioxygenase-like cupin family protein